MKKTSLLNLFILSFLLLAPFFSVFAQGVSTIEAMFLRAANWLFSFLVVGAVIGIVIGSIMILLSAGDPGKANSAKMIIIYALIAVLIGAFARGLVNAIINL
ncbi:MAG: hypothetical protein PHH17_02910 [Candidatus Pacebacteria bacterium]|jgi:hypothetical protein|nr:hypothetical protein [Candidatus Paceibacterota bacterium]MDD3729266.1 hypothetical protein [Candidatus Paceibacterota bacterium]MDD4201495.1 hypothetical protein [Candidatus Paceibacterota bacterium]MDD4466938.1 hypothetical protein [Candidatus Paceibacterota bacterium]MDD4897432.1 hypothetical protein [Candidatus Paceibacterota bacterium]